MRKALKGIAGLAVAVSALAISGPASAALFNQPVPVNATVSFNGLQWAWASPLGSPSDVDLSYQGAFGWHLPTADELLLAPNAQQFIYAGANTPFDGSDPVSGANWAYTNGQTGFGALASPYFSGYRHGDFCNGVGSACGFGEQAWNSGGFSESLVVRTLDVGQSVPEPATWAMMLLGFFGVGAAMRRKGRQQANVRFAF
ncbi:MAG: PEP-CTERM sorting domain-containing protein [Sphingomonadales bacterium]|nr:PEP-CTERM sorting domain-containing protein [Sphingomonadales bacterium]